MRNINSKHILISKKNNLAAVYNLKTLKELHFSHNTYQIGSIYIGIVDSILTNIEAAFIKLSSYDKNGFIHINSVVNKQDLFKNPNQTKRVLIQIIKEPTSGKGPNLSTNIGLIGSYMILLPFESSIKISKKISDPKEKIYLKGILSLLKPVKFGILIKKEAVKISSSHLKQDFLFLFYF
jgi:Rne/Rng family ribonuclease